MNRSHNSTALANAVRIALVAGGLCILLYIRLPKTEPDPPTIPATEGREYSEEAVALNHQANQLRYRDETEEFDPDDVIRLYERAIEADSDYLAPRVSKAYYLYELGDYAEAEVCLEELTKIIPDADFLHVYRAFCLHMLGNDAKAERCLPLALEGYDVIAEDDPISAGFGRAAIYFIQENDEAVEDELESLEILIEQSARFGHEYASWSAETREVMEKLKHGDRWMIVSVGLDEKGEPEM